MRFFYHLSEVFFGQRQVRWQRAAWAAMMLAFSLVGVDAFAAMPMSPLAKHTSSFTPPKRMPAVTYLVRPNPVRGAGLPMARPGVAANSTPLEMPKAPAQMSAKGAMSSQEAAQILDVFAAETTRENTRR